MFKGQSTHIYYFVCEDRDNPQQPNFFTIPLSKSAVKLAHICEYFPLKGTYIFRFKFSHEGFIVWLDLNDSDMKVPTFKDKIYVKVNRISWNEPPKNIAMLKNNSSKSKEQRPQKKQQLNLFDHHEEKPKVNTFSQSFGSPHQNPKSTQNNLLGGFDLTSIPNIPNNPQKEINLLGGFHGSSSPKASINNTTKHGDLI